MPAIAALGGLGLHVCDLPDDRWAGVLRAASPAAPLSLRIGEDGDEPTLTWTRDGTAGVVFGVVALGGASFLAPRTPSVIPGGNAAPGDSIADGPFRMKLAPSEPIRQASDVLLIGSFVGVLAPMAGGRDRCDRAVGRAAVVGEAALGALTATELLKHAVGRPRPYTELDPAAFGEMGSLGDWYLANHVTLTATPDGLAAAYDADATASFPSGHTASVAATSFAVTTVALFSRADRKPADFAWYAVPAALTAFTGYARVRALMHHPTDVVAGGLIGATAGVLIPLAHLDGPRPVAVTPTGNGLALVGAW